MIQRDGFERVLNNLPHSTLLQLRNVEYLRGLLDQHYTQDWRTYHNYEHIIDMLYAMNQIKVNRYTDETAIAILFHDSIYGLADSLQSGVNEKRSADLAVDFGSIAFGKRYGLGNIDWKLVKSMIMATSHSEMVSAPWEQIIADLDMMCFGDTKWLTFTASDRIIMEYTSVYPKVEVLSGRIKFLEKLSQKSFIFYDENLFPAKNDGAKANILADIERLKILLDQTERETNEISNRI